MKQRIVKLFALWSALLILDGGRAVSACAFNECDTHNGGDAHQTAIAQTATTNGTTLTLADVLRRVEASYPKLRGADAERRAARDKRVSKQGAFDLNAYSSVDYLNFNSTSARGKEVGTTVSETGIELLTRSGLKVAAGFRRNLGSVKSPLSSTGDFGETFVSAKLPLLRGRDWNEKTVGERQAFLGEPLADQNFALTRLNTLTNVGFFYWDWVAKAQKRDIARTLLIIAETREKQIRRRVDAGDLPAVDATEARLEVETRRGLLLAAELALQSAAYKLAPYLWDENGNRMDSGPLLTAQSAPQTLPIPITPTTDESARAQQVAEERRPEVRGLALSQEIVRLDRDLARNDRKPTMDFVFSPGLDTGARSVGDTLKAGFAFSLPLARREATGRQNEAERKLEKLAQDEVLLRQQIQVEVESALAAIALTYERYEATARAARTAKDLENAERRRFELGEGTLFLLNQRERATAEAQGRLIDVLAEYQQALILRDATTAQF